MTNLATTPLNYRMILQYLVAMMCEVLALGLNSVKKDNFQRANGLAMWKMAKSKHSFLEIQT